MKLPFIASAILLLAPAIAQAHYQIAPPVPASSTIAPFLTPRANTPALDAFAGVGRELQLQVRWVQIDADNLFIALPAWVKLGTAASSHVATPDELSALKLLEQTGVASTFDQQVGAINNQNAIVSFARFAPFKFILPSEMPFPNPGPLDDMVIPREKSAQTPHIPDLAKPESNLPDMAPMPNAGDKTYSQLPAPNPYVRPQASSEFEDLMVSKFQIRPTVTGQQVALELRDLNSLGKVATNGRANLGETVVFPLPSIFYRVSGIARAVRRAFLLVTPTLPASNSAPAKP